MENYNIKVSNRVWKFLQSISTEKNEITREGKIATFLENLKTFALLNTEYQPYYDNVKASTENTLDKIKGQGSEFNAFSKAVMSFVTYSEELANFLFNHT